MWRAKTVDLFSLVLTFLRKILQICPNFKEKSYVEHVISYHCCRSCSYLTCFKFRSSIRPKTNKPAFHSTNWYAQQANCRVRCWISVRRPHSIQQTESLNSNLRNIFPCSRTKMASSKVRDNFVAVLRQKCIEYKMTLPIIVYGRLFDEQRFQYVSVSSCHPINQNS